MEDYLKGLLRVLRPVEPASTPTGADSDEDSTAAAAFSRREHFFSSLRFDVAN